MNKVYLRIFAARASRWVFVLAVLPAFSARADDPDLARLKTLAAAGDAQAEYTLGKSYINGKGVPQDTRAAPNFSASPPNKATPPRKIISAPFTPPVTASGTIPPRPTNGFSRPPNTAIPSLSTTWPRPTN
jgi:hypothetical protein